MLNINKKVVRPGNVEGEREWDSFPCLHVYELTRAGLSLSHPRDEFVTVSIKNDQIDSMPSPKAGSI